MTTRRFRLCAPLALLPMAAAPALAQQEKNVAQSVLQEVVVTATKSGERSVQDTPIAVTAFDASALDRNVVTDVRDLMQMAPSLTVSENTSYAQLYMRGIGSNNVFAGADPSSTIHIDGVYIARPQASLVNFLDVERIEVLRGPQGTLYGRNSVGGTINVISRKPSLQTMQGRTQLTLGNYDLRRIEGSLSGPLVQDKLGFSVAAQFSERDAYRKNIVESGNDIDDEDSHAVRAQMRWAISDRAELMLRGDYFSSQPAVYGYHTFVEVPNAPLAASIFGDFDRVATNTPNTLDQETQGVSAELDVELGDSWSLKSITAYRESIFDFTMDSDASELSILRTHLGEDQDQLSQEFNLVARLDRLELVAGAYYFRENIDMTGRGAIDVLTVGTSRRPEPIVETTAWALFGQASWRFNDVWSATLGLRYTEEEKQYTKNDGVYSLATDQLLTNLSFPTETGRYEELTPRFGVEYQPRDNVLVYASASSGFKSGGFNATAVAPGGYDPEIVWAYEVGVKSDLFDRRLRLNISAFDYDYKDLQVQSFIVAGQTDITNASDAKIRGLELELLARPIGALDVRLSAAWLEAEYAQYGEAPVSGGLTIDASGNRLNNAPEWSGSLALQYEHDVRAGSVRLNGEYSWQSETFFTVDNNQVDREGSYGLVNASLAYITGDGRWNIALWGRNLTDEEYVTSVAQFTIPGSSGRAGAPRTYGLRATWTF